MQVIPVQVNNRGARATSSGASGEQQVRYPRTEIRFAQHPSNQAETPGPRPQANNTIQAYQVAPARADQKLFELQQAYRSNGAVQFSLDRRTGRILVNAPPDVQAQVARHLGQAAAIAAPPPPQPTQLRLNAPKPASTRQVLGLVHIGWPEIRDALTAIWGSNLPVISPAGTEPLRLALPVGSGEVVNVAVDRRNRKVEIQGSADAALAWRELIQAIDRPVRKVEDRAHVLPLRYAARDKVKTALAAFQPNNAGQDADNQPPPPGNAAQPNGPNGAGPDNAAPGDAAQAAMPDSGAPIGPVQVEFLDGLDVIIIRGNPRDVQRVAKIIEDIERLSVENEPEIRIYRLAHVGSEALAELIVPLYGQVLQSAQGRVSITALVKPNALLLIGRADSVQAVLGLVQQLDRPVPPAAEFGVFQLKHLAVGTAEETLREFFEERGGLGTRIRIVSDFRSNALIVQASPRDLAEVAALIQKIDVARGKAVNEVRVFRLTNSLAQDLAQVLQAAIQAQGGAGPLQQQPTTGQAGQVQQSRSAMLTLKTLDPASRRILRSGILSDVRVTADVRANALVVTAPPENMALIGELIRQLDQLPSAEAQLKVFTIVNADAVSLADVLQDLFGDVAATGQFGQTAADGSIVPLRFSVDQRTNSIIVSGAGSDLEVVEAILLRLDESDVRERQNTVYRLNNAPALDVSNAVNEFLRSQRQVEQIAPETVSPFQQIEREVIVVPEPVNNSLIISATPRYYNEIIKLVEELDKRPPMVLIQVLIAEVRLADTDELGVELGVQDSLLFDRSSILTALDNTLDPGFLFNNRQLGNSSSATSLATRNHFAPQVISNFSVMRSNSELGYGGLVISGGNDEVSILIRALQDDRRLDVLSRPQVMTLDNQPAFVQVGQRVPRITSSQVTTGGTVINNTVLENVGILLGVTPRISPEGLVVMEIDAEKSRLGDVNDGIPISVNNNGDVIRSPIIDTITAQTTVSALSGQTVILGGLITKEDQNIARRVPHLSEIPILGSLFRYDSISHLRTELLFIMTPYIVRDEKDVEMVNQMESQRMSWCLADVVSVQGNVNLGHNGNSRVGCWDCDPTNVIYPDLTPTAPEILETPAPLPAPPGALQAPFDPSASSGQQMMRHQGVAGVPLRGGPAFPVVPAVSSARPGTVYPTQTIVRVGFEEGANSPRNTSAALFAPPITPPFSGAGISPGRNDRKPSWFQAREGVVNSATSGLPLQGDNSSPDSGQFDRQRPW